MKIPLFLKYLNYQLPSTPQIVFSIIYDSDNSDVTLASLDSYYMLLEADRNDEIEHSNISPTSSISIYMYILLLFSRLIYEHFKTTVAK